MPLIANNLLTTTSLVLLTAFAGLPALAADIDAASTINAVMVYPDGASVTRVINVDLPAGDNTLIVRDFPLALDASSLRVEGEAGARLTIGPVEARPPRAVQPVNLPEIDKRIEALRDEHADLQGVIAAAAARGRFAERFAETSATGTGDKGQVRPIAEWRAAITAVAEEIATADTAIRDTKRKQRDLDREIARLQSEREAKPPSKVEVRVEVAASAATKATLKVTYAVRDARWLPLYDARLDTDSKNHESQLELVRRAEVRQSTGEDWSNVTLSVSTARIGRGGSAPELNSLIVQYPQPPRAAVDGALSAGAPMAGWRARLTEAAEPLPAAVEKRVAASEQQADAEIGNFQATFKIPGSVSLGASEGAKAIRISTTIIAPDLAVRAAPVADPTAFLEASFTQADDVALLPGDVAIYRNGMFVGHGKIAASAKDDIVRLGFGADDKIKIERAVLKRKEGPGGRTRDTDERMFKTTVRNGHDFPIKITIEDRLPVSENKEILVEMMPSTTPPTASNIRDKRGVLEWAFEAKPYEVKDINFGWRARWPKDKSIVMVPAG